MQKIQQMIDAAFGKQAEREPQRPSEASLEREHALNERTRKVAALKEARLRDGGARRAPAMLFEVVRHRGHWRVRHNHRHSTPYPDQSAAILGAKQLARKKRLLGHPVEVRLVRADGQIIPQSIEDDVEI